MKYDFVLFENYYLAKNHHKDVLIIAKLLHQCNYTVAIADPIGGDESFNDENISIINHPFKYASELKYYGKITLMQSIKNKWRVFQYYTSLYSMIKDLKGKCKNLYAGSYFSRMPVWWMFLLPKDINIFFWGLRSSRLIEYKYQPFSISGINSFFLRCIVNRRKNIKFFVSDEIIKDEFIKLGIGEKRLVVRPERVIGKLHTAEKSSDKNTLRLLSIGSIRKQKKIEFCLDAVRRLNNENISFVIAGNNTDEDYENTIKKHSEGLKNVTRLNYRIPDQEYDTLMNEADFLVLCDEQQLSTVTNGTMNEALLKGTPIIAPNYNPYKYYIEKYGIGLLYDPKNSQSLEEAIEESFKKGKQSFSDAIKNYQNSLLEENVLIAFRNNLEYVIA